jgi:hypothetical protein
MADFISDPRHNSAVGPVPEVSDVGGNKRRARSSRQVCSVCGREVLTRDIVRLDVVRPAMIERIRQEKPDLPADGFICRADLDRFRSSYVSQLLTRERGELTRLEHEVVKSLADHETLAENIEAEYVGQRTLGERMSDRLASFGGSWTFIISVRCRAAGLDGVQHRGRREVAIRSLIPSFCSIWCCHAWRPSRLRSS